MDTSLDFLYSEMREDGESISHHGVAGQKWGVRNAKWYPIEDYLKSISNSAKGAISTLKKKRAAQAAVRKRKATLKEKEKQANIIAKEEAKKAKAAEEMAKKKQDILSRADPKEVRENLNLFTTQELDDVVKRANNASALERLDREKVSKAQRRIEKVLKYYGYAKVAVETTANIKQSVDRITGENQKKDKQTSNYEAVLKDPSAYTDKQVQAAMTRASNLKKTAEIAESMKKKEVKHSDISIDFLYSEMKYDLSSLSHHGIAGQKWGTRHGPPYPLDANAHSSAEKRAAKAAKYGKAIKRNEDRQKRIEELSERKHSLQNDMERCFNGSQKQREKEEAKLSKLLKKEQRKDLTYSRKMEKLHESLQKAYGDDEKVAKIEKQLKAYEKGRDYIERRILGGKSAVKNADLRTKMLGLKYLSSTKYIKKGLMLGNYTFTDGAPTYTGKGNSYISLNRKQFEVDLAAQKNYRDLEKKVTGKIKNYLNNTPDKIDGKVYMKMEKEREKALRQIHPYDRRPLLTIKNKK